MGAFHGRALAAMRSNIALAAGRPEAVRIADRYLESRLAALALLRGDPPQVDLSGRRLLQDALARGRGALVVSAHVGSWELGAAAAARLAPVHSVAGVQLRAGWTRWIRAALRSYDLHVHAAPLALRTLGAALGRGEIAALQLDGDQGGHRLAVPFLGRRIALAAGAAWLAATCAPAVLTGVCVREGGRWLGRLSSVTPPQDESVTGWHEKLAGEIERVIRAWPDQWLLPSPILRWSESERRV